VIKPPYPLDPPGISDHKYVTEHLGIGDHTDMGDDFIWDILESDVNEFLGVSLSRDPQIDYVFDELSKLLASRSPYRGDDNPFETAVGVLLMVDRSEHMRLVEDAAQARTGVESFAVVWHAERHRCGQAVLGAQCQRIVTQ
jgi:hypothetical protein